MSFKSQPPVIEGEKEVVVGINALAEKLSNDVACGDDFSPDFSSEHVGKASSNGDVRQNDDDDVVSVVDGGVGSEEENSRPAAGKVVPAASALPSSSLEASSPEGTPLTARKLFATPDSDMKVAEFMKLYQK